MKLAERKKQKSRKLFFKEVNQLLPGKIRPSWKDWDFSYLLNDRPKKIVQSSPLFSGQRTTGSIPARVAGHQAKLLVRMAAIYEYARESPELIKAIKAHEQDLKFPDSLQAIYEWGELEFLAYTPGFPWLSFHQVLASGSSWENMKSREFLETYLLRTFPSWNRTEIGQLDSSTIRRLSRQLAEDGNFRLARSGLTDYYATIDWNCTNDAIVEQLGRFVPGLRPKSLPERKHPGRRGDLRTREAMPLLRQLAAYRLVKSGRGRDVGKSEFLFFKSLAGPARHAEKRIGLLTIKHPLAV